MTITTGKQRGKSLEFLTLNDPSYVAWLMQQQKLRGRLLAVRKEVLRLLALFDARPLIFGCSGEGCTMRATRASFVFRVEVPLWWCNDCDPYDAGVPLGTLGIVRTYADGLSYAEAYVKTGLACARVISELKVAKGLPREVDEETAQWFFSPDWAKTHAVPEILLRAPADRVEPAPTTPKPWDLMTPIRSTPNANPPQDTLPDQPMPTATTTGTALPKPKVHEATYWHARGRDHFHYGNFTSALECYEKSLAADPSNPQAWIDKGICYLPRKIAPTLDDPDKWDRCKYAVALKGFDMALQLDPESLLALLFKADTLTDMGEYDAAIAAYDRIIELYPDDDYPWCSKGYIHWCKSDMYCLTGEHDKAVNECEQELACREQALKINPDDKQNLSNRDLARHDLAEFRTCTEAEATTVDGEAETQVPAG